MARRTSPASAVALVLTATLACLAARPADAQGPPGPRADSPAGQVTFALTITIAPTWFDPAETPGVISGGIRSYGGYPDIDALFRDQASEMDRKRRENLLHKIQQLMDERAMFAPIVEQASLTGVGPRLAEVPAITGHAFVSPYEDVRLKP